MKENAQTEVQSPPQTKSPKYSDVRLLLMSQEHIGKYRNLIMAHLANAYGRWGNPTVITNFMAELGSGLLQAWAIVGYVEDANPQLLGLLTTRIIKDARFSRTVLYIETIDANGAIPRSAWAKSLAKLQRYAVKNKCDIIEADVHNPAVARMSERIGFTVASTKLLMEVSSDA